MTLSDTVSFFVHSKQRGLTPASTPCIVAASVLPWLMDLWLIHFLLQDVMSQTMSTGVAASKGGSLPPPPHAPTHKHARARAQLLGLDRINPEAQIPATILVPEILLSSVWCEHMSSTSGSGRSRDLPWLGIPELMLGQVLREKSIVWHSEICRPTAETSQD